MTLPNPPFAARTAGALLVATTVLSLLALSHHPTAGGDDAAAVVAQVRAVGGMARAVHGALLALMLVQWLCLLEFSSHRGLLAWGNRSGLLLWSAGTLAMGVAALLSGFVVPALADQTGAGALDPASVVAQMAFAHALNQSFAVSGSLLMAAAVMAWSSGLLRSVGWARPIGASGLVAGAAIALLLVGGIVRLDVHGMLLVWSVLSAWLLLVGIGLVARRL